MKKVAILILLVSLVFLCAMSKTDGKTYTVNYQSINFGGKIIIDAGHGGFDGGAVAPDGTLEKDINLKIAQMVESFCNLGGFQVIMTRQEDSGIEKDDTDTISNRKKSDMKRRLNIINENPDALFVSIHLNKFQSSAAKGSQVFYSANNPLSECLAQAVQLSVVSKLQPENDRLIKKADSSIYLLKNSKIPSIIVECGFLSNGDELLLLKDSEYQSKMAFSIYCGILDYIKTGEN